MTIASSIGAHAAPRTRALAQTTDVEEPNPTPDAPPPDGEVKDPQGKIWKSHFNPDTGDMEFRREETQAEPDGSATLTSKFGLFFHPDGTYDKSTHQVLEEKSGASTEALAIEKYGNNGKQTSEVVDLTQKDGPKISTQHSESTFTAGVETHKFADIVNRETGTDDDNSEIEVVQNIHAEWDENGAPITDTTAPRLTLNELTSATTPNAGLHHPDAEHPNGFNRVMTIERNAASGDDGALVWKPMNIKVRFEGRDGQYLERSMSYELDANGSVAPGTKPTQGPTDDHRPGLVRGAEKVRIWAGLSTNLVGFIGAAMIRSDGLKGAIAKVAVGTGIGAGLLNAAAEGYAVSQRQVDANVGRAFMNLYDTGLLAAVAWANTQQGRGLMSEKFSPTAATGVVAGGVALGVGGDAAQIGANLVSDHGLEIPPVSPMISAPDLSGLKPDINPTPALGFDPERLLSLSA